MTLFNRLLLVAFAFAGLAASAHAAPPAAHHPSRDAFAIDEVQQDLANEPRATNFLSALSQSDVTLMLTPKSGYTAFVPVNEAFQQLSPADAQALSNPDRLRAVLRHHVSQYALSLQDLNRSHDLFYTLSGHTVALTEVRQDYFVNGRKVLDTIKSPRGVIYLVEDFILPPSNTPVEPYFMEPAMK